MKINNPGGGAELTVAETQVYNANAPLAWTDLDLSAVVGARPALVLLKLWMDAGGDPFAVRKNGDTDEFYIAGATNAEGVACVLLNGAGHRCVAVATDDNGIIEIRGGQVAACTIDLIAFLA